CSLRSTRFRFRAEDRERGGYRCVGSAGVADADANTSSYVYSYSYGHGDIHADAHRNRHGHGNSYLYSHSYGDRNVHAYTNTNADAMLRRQLDPDRQHGHRTRVSPGDAAAQWQGAGGGTIRW